MIRVHDVTMYHAMDLDVLHVRVIRDHDEIRFTLPTLKRHDTPSEMVDKFRRGLRAAEAVIRDGTNKGRDAWNDVLTVRHKLAQLYSASAPRSLSTDKRWSLEEDMAA